LEKGSPVCRGPAEERHRRTELQVVGRVEDLEQGAVAEIIHQPRALQQARAERVMLRVRDRLRSRPNRIALRHRAQPEAFELRKDKPHPVALLGAATQLGDDARVDGRLGGHEALQLEGILGHRVRSSIAALRVRFAQRDWAPSSDPGSGAPWTTDPFTGREPQFAPPEERLVPERWATFAAARNEAAAPAGKATLSRTVPGERRRCDFWGAWGPPCTQSVGSTSCEPHPSFIP